MHEIPQHSTLSNALPVAALPANRKKGQQGQETNIRQNNMHRHSTAAVASKHTPARAGTRGWHRLHLRNNRHFCRLTEPTSAGSQIL
jgi:hypothetical protein